MHSSAKECPCLRRLTALQTHLAAMDANETTHYQANTSEARGLPKAAAFVLECLARLPQAFQVALGQLILLQPFTEVTKKRILHALVVVLALKYSCLSCFDTTLTTSGSLGLGAVSCCALTLCW